MITITIPVTSRAASAVAHNRSRSHSQSISKSRTQSTSRSSRTPSISVGGPTLYRGNSFAAAKKASFSSASVPFSRSNSHMSGLTSRGESFAQPTNNNNNAGGGGGTTGGGGGGRDRKMSFDIVAQTFQLSSSQTEEAAATLMNISQRENYCSGVEALWPAYSQEIEAQITALENQDFCMPISAFNHKTPSSSSLLTKSSSKRSSKSKGVSSGAYSPTEAVEEIIRGPANPLTVLSNLMAPPVEGSIPSLNRSSHKSSGDSSSSSSKAAELDAKIDLLFRKNEFPFITNGQRLDPKYIMLSNFGDDMTSIPGKKGRCSSIALSVTKTAVYEADKVFASMTKAVASSAKTAAATVSTSSPPPSPVIMSAAMGHSPGPPQNGVKVGGNARQHSPKCSSPRHGTPNGRATVIDPEVEVSGKPPIRRPTSSNISTPTSIPASATYSISSVTPTTDCHALPTRSPTIAAGTVNNTTMETRSTVNSPNPDRTAASVVTTIDQLPCHLASATATSAPTSADSTASTAAADAADVELESGELEEEKEEEKATSSSTPFSSAPRSTSGKSEESTDDSPSPAFTKLSRGAPAMTIPKYTTEGSY